MKRMPETILTALAVLACVLLSLLCAAVFQLTLLLSNARASTQRLEQRADALLCESQRRLAQTSANANAVLVQLGLAADEWRRASVYSTAISRTTAELLANTDQRAERVTTAWEKAATETGAGIQRVSDAAATAARETERTSAEAQAALRSATAVMSNLERLSGDESISLASQRLADASAHLATASANTAEATGYVRDMFSPRRPRFWRRLLELLLPRPAINIRR